MAERSDGVMPTQELSMSPTGDVATAWALTVEGISFRYSATQPSRPWTVDHVSFNVAFGEIVGIVGPNGSGKSSLLKLLPGLLRPQSGSVRLIGQAIDNLTPLAIARAM